MNTLSSPGLRVEPRQQGDVSVLGVAGDVDAANAQVLREAVVTAIDSGPSVLVVDLTEVGYIDSVGLGTLVVGLKRASERGATMRLVVTSPQIQKVLNITGLLSVFEIYNNAPAAIKGGGGK
jgi:anti-sigma B factor antagonist